MAMTDEQRKGVASAAWLGMSAIMFATSPQQWQAFAAFAEQQSGDKWTEADRLRMRDAGRVLYALAETADAGMTGPAGATTRARP